MTELKGKMEKFCHEYLIDLNATQAAIRAGYSQNSASEIGYENLRKPQIKARLQELRQEIAEKVNITPEMVVAEYAKIGFANLDRFINRDESLPRFDFNDLTSDEMAAVSEITVDTRREKGEDGAEIDKVKFKLYDKKGALDSLSRHMGLFEKDNEQQAPQQSNMSPEDIARRVAFLLRAGQEEQN